MQSEKMSPSALLPHLHPPCALAASAANNGSSCRCLAGRRLPLHLNWPCQLDGSRPLAIGLFRLPVQAPAADLSRPGRGERRAARGDQQLVWSLRIHLLQGKLERLDYVVASVCGRQIFWVPPATRQEHAKLSLRLRPGAMPVTVQVPFKPPGHYRFFSSSGARCKRLLASSAAGPASPARIAAASPLRCAAPPQPAPGCLPRVQRPARGVHR